MSSRVVAVAGEVLLIPLIVVGGCGKERFAGLCLSNLPISRSRNCCSSSRPISSKCEMSESRVSPPVREDEWTEEDLEDLEAVRPGGEPGG